MRGRVHGWRIIAACRELARDLLLSKDNFQQLHVIDDCVYGVFSDLVRDIDAATEETGFLRFAMTEQLADQRPPSGALRGGCDAPRA